MSDRKKSSTVDVPEPPVHLVNEGPPGPAPGSALDRRIQEVEGAIASGKEFTRDVQPNDEVDDDLEDGLDLEAEDPSEQLAELLGQKEQPGEDEPEEEKPAAELDQEEPEDEDERGLEDEPETPEEEEEEAPEEEAFVLALPGRGPNDPDVEIELEGLDQEQREAFSRMRNGYARKEQLRAERDAVMETKELVDDFVLRLQTDPINTTLEEFPDVETQASLALHVLANKEVYEKVVGQIAEWDRNEDKREAAAARLQLERRESADKATRARADAKAARQSAELVRQAVTAIIPEGMGDTEAASFWDAAMYDVQRHVNDKKLNRISAEQVVEVLNQSGALRRFGIDRADAERIVANLNATPSDTPARARAKPRQSEPAGREAEARKTGERLRSRSARRRAAATTPRGAGSPPARLKMPKGQGVEERAEWFLKNRTGRG